jgi:OmpR family response regulator NblR
LGDNATKELCKSIRSNGLVLPVIILTNHDQVIDRIFCLESGADDYLLKPFQSDIYIKRIQFYLQPQIDPTDKLHFADLVLEIDHRRVLRKNQVIDLTMKEFELLKYLMLNAGEVLTHEQILENVWGYDFDGASNIIQVYIRYLRIKLQEDTNKPLIQTVRGVGYVLREI